MLLSHFIFTIDWTASKIINSDYEAANEHLAFEHGLVKDSNIWDHSGETRAKFEIHRDESQLWENLTDSWSGDEFATLIGVESFYQWKIIRWL